MRRSGHPSLAEHIARLGTIAHYWNRLESSIEVVPMLYSTDELTGLFITRLAPRNLVMATREIVEHREKNPRVRDAVHFALTALDIIRENRNILVHSIDISAVTGRDVAWIRRNKLRPWERMMSRANLRDLTRLESAMVHLEDYVEELVERIAFDRGYPFPYWSQNERAEKRPPLPRRFPMPRKLDQIP